MTDNAPQASYYQPSLAMRFWRWLGFGLAYDASLIDWRTEDPPEGAWWKPGAFVTETRITFGGLERLRILITGKIEVQVSSRVDVIVNRSEARAVVSVLSPLD